MCPPAGVYRRRSWACVIVCLLVSLTLFVSTVLVVVAYRGSQVAKLHAELTALRRDVDSLKLRIVGEDLLEQLRAFEDAVSTSCHHYVLMQRTVFFSPTTFIKTAPGIRFRKYPFTSRGSCYMRTYEHMWPCQQALFLERSFPNAPRNK